MTTSLLHFYLAASVGFEPTALHLEGGRSFQLSYEAILIFLTGKKAPPCKGEAQVTGEERRKDPGGSVHCLATDQIMALALADFNISFLISCHISTTLFFSSAVGVCSSL